MFVFLQYIFVSTKGLSYKLGLQYEQLAILLLYYCIL